MTTDWLDLDSTPESITAAAIDSLMIRGDMAGDVTTSDASARAMTASITGSIQSGQWHIAGSMSSLRTTGSITNFSLVSGGEIRSITTGRDGQLAAKLQAASFGSIRSGGVLMGAITASGVSTRGQSVGQISATSIEDLTLDAAGDVASIRSGDIADLDTHIAGSLASLTGKDLQDVTAQIDGSLRSVNVYNWNHGQLSAGSIATFSVRDDLTGLALALTDVPDENAARPRPVLGTLRVSGSVQDLDLSAVGDITSITAGAMSDSYIHVGVASGTQDVLTPVTFADTGSIRTFMVRGLAGLDEASFDSTVIQVRTLGSVTLQEVDESDTGGEYGVITSSIDRFTRRGGDRQFIRLGQLQDTLTADQAGTFILRII
jgi:hypothetical protein